MAIIKTYRTEISASAEEVFNWHNRAPAFSRYNQPWDPVAVISRTAGANGNISDGAEIVLSIPVFGPARIRWRIGHCNYDPPKHFEDYQIRGPFRSWHHVHRFLPQEPNCSILEDEIRFEIPPALHSFGPAGRMLEADISRRLDRLFGFRSFVIAGDLALYKRYDQTPRTILIAGGSGLVGRALRDLLGCLGHRVISLVRRPTAGNPDEVFWNPELGVCDLSVLPPIDAVVNLCGENVASLWTERKRNTILSSRVNSTKTLVSAFGKLDRRPAVFICASAIGIYGPQNSQPCDESAPIGTGFLADVCRAWEDEAVKAEPLNIRTVRLRIGIVLTPLGGALGSMLPPFRFGLGGVLGSGNQILSWISIDDLIGAIYHSIQTEGVTGPVNAVSLTPVSNKIFTKELASVLHRPAVLPVPAALLRTLPGGFANQTVLSSSTVLPRTLLNTGFSFRLPNLRQALNTYLGRRP